MRYGFNYNEGELKGKNEKIKKRNDRKNLYRTFPLSGLVP